MNTVSRKPRHPVMKRIALVVLCLFILTGAVLLLTISLQTSATEPPTMKEPQGEQANAPAVIVEPPSEQPPTPAPQQNPAGAEKTGGERAQDREITLDLDTPVPSPEQPAGRVPVYSMFDFLRAYLTNHTHSIIVEGKPWANSTVNFQQYQLELEGVTYWDFFSEHENWDSPSYLWLDDDGQWRAYEKQVIRDPAGQNVSAYLLLDRKGPGVMDKIWFTEDAVWMLTTPQSTRDVGPIENMAEFLEWGNLEKLGNVRIEVDDRIAYDGSLRDWLSGRAFGLTPELAQILTWRHRQYGSSGSILPIPYQKHLRVLLYGGSKKPKWFLATGVRFAENAKVKPYTGTKTDLPLDEMTRLARNVLQPENYLYTLDNLRAFDLKVQPERTSVIQLNGSGTLAAFQFRITKKYDPKQLWMRIKYGNDVALSLPLIAFFGDHRHLTLHRSTPLGVIEADDAYLFYCNLPLPFQSGLTIELTTSSPNPLVVSARVATARERANTQLWVEYREGEKTVMYGPDYQVRLTGDGKVVGLVLATEGQGLDTIPKISVPGKPEVEDPVKRAWPMGYLEGNLTLTDGAGNNRIYGGHEDWADGGFYFNRGYTNPAGGSNRPFGGLLRYQDGKDGYASLFRYFNDLSAFRFKNGLQMNFGHGTWNNNFPVKFGVTVYYYKEIKGIPPARLPASEYAMDK